MLMVVHVDGRCARHSADSVEFELVVAWPMWRPADW